MKLSASLVIKCVLALVLGFAAGLDLRRQLKGIEWKSFWICLVVLENLLLFNLMPPMTCVVGQILSLPFLDAEYFHSDTSDQFWIEETFKYGIQISVLNLLSWFGGMYFSDLVISDPLNPFAKFFEITWTFYISYQFLLAFGLLIDHPYCGISILAGLGLRIYTGQHMLMH